MGRDFEYKKMTTYDPNIHPAKAYQCLAKGKSEQELLVELGIARSTFYAWMETKEAFNTAVNTGLDAGVALWIEYGRQNMENPDFNENAYNNYLSRVYGITKQKRRRIDLTSQSGSLVEGFSKLLKMLDRGESSSMEAKDLSKVLLDGATLKEHEELNRKVKALEEQMNGKNSK